MRHIRQEICFGLLALLAVAALAIPCTQGNAQNHAEIPPDTYTPSNTPYRTPTPYVYRTATRAPTATWTATATHYTATRVAYTVTVTRTVTPKSLFSAFMPAISSINTPSPRQYLTKTAAALITPPVTPTLTLQPPWGKMPSPNIPNYNWGNPVVMVIDREGRPHLFWDINLAESQEGVFIYHTYLTDQGWLSPEIIAQTLGYSELPSAVVDTDGRIHVMWRNKLSLDGGPYRLMYANWFNGQWSYEEELAYDSSNPISGQMRLDSQNRVQALISVDHQDLSSAGASYKCDYRVYSSSSGWQPPETINFPLVPIGEYGHRIINSIGSWLTREGGVIVQINQEIFTTGVSDIYYSYWKGGSFVTQSYPLGKTVGGILDGLNNLHMIRKGNIVAPGGSIQTLYHQCFTSDLTLLPEALISVDDEDVLSTSETVDNGNRYALAWNNNNKDQNLALGIWNGCDHIWTSKLASQISYIEAIAISNQPNKVCILSGSPYFSLVCANIGSE